MKAYVTPRSLAKKTERWLAKVAPFNRDELRIQRDTTALLVIDMQDFFLQPDSPAFTCGGLAILPTVRRLIAAFRKANRPIIYTRHVHHPDGLDAGIMAWWWDGMCIEGSPESEVHRELAPLGNEKVVFKHRYSAFYDTDAETVLRCLGIEDLVISGVMTNMCCESTARDAYYRDYRVFFLADGTGTVSEEMHVASLLNLAYGFASVTTAGRVIRQLGG